MLVRIDAGVPMSIDGSLSRTILTPNGKGCHPIHGLVGRPECSVGFPRRLKYAILRSGLLEKRFRAGHPGPMRSLNT
jgi:hypothetical protein